ncbi:MAG: polysulfide reductase NrfD [Betaproteobacteria bacterium]|nr:polysulfide reductase NrfD [Betaproteobacteria bacterium]
MATPAISPASARRVFWALAAAGGAVLAVALGAAHYMEQHGHIVTGMNNQVVWGLPHVFAIFLIVAASGALNVASVGSVFGESGYKPFSPLSVLLTVALLAGGLLVLVLDLGRPERLLVAATHYNFRSIFAWNMILYNGLFVICALYLWSLLERRLGKFAKPVGLAAFAWRIILTTGTGSIFGFLVARQAYASGVIAPLFIALSLAWGLAVFHLAQSGLAQLAGEAMSEELQGRVRRLLGIFVVAALYFVAVHHMTNLYWAKQTAFEHFILVTGAPYPVLFWIGYVGLGSVVPLALLFHPRLAGPRSTALASGLVSLGAFALLYVFIIGGQAFPLEIFPGYEVASSFSDGKVDAYAPSLPEFLLGIGGLAASFLIALVGVHALPILPLEAFARPAAAPAK